MKQIKTVSTKEAAAILGLNDYTYIHRLVALGKLTATKYPNRRDSVRVHLDSVERLKVLREMAV